MNEPDPLAWFVDEAWPAFDRFVVVTDPVAARFPAASSFLSRAAAVHVVPNRPTLAEGAAIASLIDQTGATAVVGMGSGVALDAAKLGAFERARVAARPALVPMPCGPEPYRAVTPFAMYDVESGTRIGMNKPWFAASRVHIIPELIGDVDDPSKALFAGDSLVHAIESLLSRASTPESEVHAGWAASVFSEQCGSRDPHGTRLLVEASIRAAYAFEITKLGLAHALSRPLGIVAGVSHDRFNLMLGPAVVEFWGDPVLGAQASDWVELMCHYREAAGLPENIAALGVDWSGMEAAIDWAPNSSGIPNLPRPVTDADLRAIAHRAWSG